MSSRTSVLAQGKAQTTTFQCPFGGWTFRTKHAPILKNSDNSTSADSTGAWKRELGMTTVAGMSLPSATYGSSLAEVMHEPSGVRISFCALEALRTWRLLDIEPVPHLSQSAGPPQWEYTFTTSYRGATSALSPASTAESSMEPSAAVIDGQSLHSRPAVDLVKGVATLRKPLCKCRGSSGRETLIQIGTQKKISVVASQEEASHGELGRGALKSQLPHLPPAPMPPPEWAACDEPFDVDALLNTVRGEPLFLDAVDLWRDDMEPHSSSFLHVRILVAEAFWLVRLRCYVRVNGVRARLLDTCYVCRRVAPHRLLRTSSWREGVWDDLAGPGAPAHMGFEEVGERVAAARLPLLRPCTTEELTLPKPPSADDTHRHAVTLVDEAWRREVGGFEALDRVDGVVIVVCGHGETVEALDAESGEELWRRASASFGTGEVLVAAVAPATSRRNAHGGSDGPLLALGTSRAEVHVLVARSAERVFTFTVGEAVARPPGTPIRGCTACWVEHIAWSRDGRHVGASAGRVVSIAREGRLISTGRAAATVYALEFADEGCTSARTPTEADRDGASDGGCTGASLAVGAYGGISWMHAASQLGACNVTAAAERAVADTVTLAPSLEIGAAAVLSVAVSPDGRLVAAGCLDKRARIFRRSAPEGGGADVHGGARDWIGFDGPVGLLAWDPASEWLAASGGGTLLALRRDLPSGTAPTVCQARHGRAASEQPVMAAVAWLSSHLLIALDGATARAFIFDVARATAEVPRRAALVAVVAPSHAHPTGAARATQRMRGLQTSLAVERLQPTGTAGGVVKVVLADGETLRGLRVRYGTSDACMHPDHEDAKSDDTVVDPGSNGAQRLPLSADAAVELEA